MKRRMVFAAAGILSVFAALAFDNSRLAAHRADNARFPQNTVAAIQSAVEQGAGMIEIDIRRCATGEMLVICEPDLAETTDGTGTVQKSSFAYLRSLSACAPKKFGDRFKGKYKIPTPEEALAAIPKDGPYINLHCGDDTHLEIAKMVEKTGRLNRAFIGVAHFQIKRLRKAVPGIMLCNMQRPASGSKTWTKEQHWQYARETVEHNCQFVQYIGVNNAPPADVVDYLHKNGVKVSYVKNDDPAQRRKLFFETDVDFIFTDRLPAKKSGVNLAWNGHFEEIRNGIAYNWKGFNGFKFMRGAGRSGSAGAELLSHNEKKPAYIESDFHISGGRSYEVSVWIKTEGVEGGKSGAMIYAEVKDANGKYIQGAEIYPRGATGTKGWARYAGIINAPYHAVKMSAGVMLFAGTKGKAWADDFSCVMLPDVPVKAVVTDAYRNVTDRKKVKVSALLGTEAAEDKTLRVRSGISDASGRCILTGGAAKNGITAAAEFDLGRVPPGKYKAWVALEGKDAKLSARKECPLEVVKKLPSRKVFVDEHQRTIVDGKAFFPVGMYSYDIKEADIARYAQSPFNCIMSYRVPTNEQMDCFQRYGLKAVVGFSNYFYGLAKEFKTIDEETDFFTNSIKRLKSHPATLAWYLHDEIPLSYMPRLLARQKLAHSLDPDHPTWGVLCLPYNTGLLLDTFDICGNDPYPVYHDGKRDMEKSWLWARLSKELSLGSRGIWQVPQAFSWGNYQKLAEAKSETRLPTCEEMRMMTYQQLAGGANGLIYYSFHDVQKTFRENTQVGEKHWENVKRMVEEVRKYEMVWLSVEPGALEIKEPPGAKLSVRTWKKDGRDYILVSSGENKESSYAFKLPVKRGAVKTLIGDMMRLENCNSLSVSLKPYGMAFAELSGAASCASGGGKKEKAAAPAVEGLKNGCLRSPELNPRRFQY